MSVREGIPREMQKILDNGESVTLALQSWDNHVKERREIAAFTTIVKDQMYVTKPAENQIFIPYSEYHGDHDMNWILCIDTKTNKEVFRKNVRMIDMIDWKLFSS